MGRSCFKGSIVECDCVRAEKEIRRNGEQGLWPMEGRWTLAQRNIVKRVCGGGGDVGGSYSDAP